jgi:hypothetical protein
MLPLGVLWLWCGAIGDMFEQLAVFPLTKYTKTSSLPMPKFDFSRSTRHNVLMGFFYFPLIVQGLVLIWLLRDFFRKNFSKLKADFTFILAFSILFYCQALSRSDVYHLLATLGPFFVLCAIGTSVLSSAAEKGIQKLYSQDSLVSTSVKVAISAGAGVICLWFLIYMKPIFLSSPKEPLREVAIERCYLAVSEKEAELTERAIAAIQAHSKANKSILCLPYQPMLYFLSNRSNPTHYDYLWPGDQSPREHQELVDQARSGRPSVVAIIEKTEMQRYAPAIIEYVDAEFRFSNNYGRMALYLPLEQ